ncbi:hypothetical protein GCM10025784_14580 [Citricoccus nitrophenolicus]
MLDIRRYQDTHVYGDASRSQAFYAGLDSTPPLYGTDAEPGPAKLAYAHYTLDTVVGTGHWFIVEYDPGSFLAYGYLVIAGCETGSWGHFDIRELESVISRTGLRVERDSGWLMKPMADIADIGVLL